MCLEFDIYHLHDFCRATAATILSAVYGWPSITDKDDHIVEQVHGVAHRITEAVAPGAFLVDIFPILKHAPLWAAKWKRDGLDWFRRQSEIFEGFNKRVEEKMVGQLLYLPNLSLICGGNPLGMAGLLGFGRRGRSFFCLCACRNQAAS